MDDKTTTDLEARIEELERRTRRGDSRETMETAFWAVMHNVFPEDTRRHLKAASREQLLAARTYLDHWISKMADKPAGEKQAERETIEVE
jgi:hypothetical protein